MKITVIGLGYVGLSLGLLLSQNYHVIAYDTDKDKIDMLLNKKSPIQDHDIDNFLSNKALNFSPTNNKEKAFKDSDFFIISTPTNYNTKTGFFDTSSVVSSIKDVLEVNSSAHIVIKSTVPLGFTDRLNKKFKTNKIFFSPEFLRESKALHDNLFPSRIIVGAASKEADLFASMLAKSSKIEDKISIIKMSSREAEAVKLFSNTYLAMRTSFFNELDSFAEVNNLSSLNIIKGVSSDPRIGDYYNNPSFGYGGYCLPKDTKQLLEHYSNVPNNIIKSVVEANETRKNFILQSIISKSPKVVGIYRLIMKSNSDNFRESAILDIVEKLRKEKIELVIYEPLINDKYFNHILIINQLNKFISESDIIIANRMSDDLMHVKSKVYTRDLFKEN